MIRYQREGFMSAGRELYEYNGANSSLVMELIRRNGDKMKSMRSSRPRRGNALSVCTSTPPTTAPRFVNAVGDRIRRKFYHRVGLSDLLRPARKGRPVLAPDLLLRAVLQPKSTLSCRRRSPSGPNNQHLPVRARPAARMHRSLWPPGHQHQANATSKSRRLET